jgi:hypothetical protein
MLKQLCCSKSKGTIFVFAGVDALEKQILVARDHQQSNNSLDQQWSSYEPTRKKVNNEMSRTNRKLKFLEKITELGRWFQQLVSATD